MQSIRLGVPIQPIPSTAFEDITAPMTIIGATIHGTLLYSIMLYTSPFYQAGGTSSNLECLFYPPASVLECSIFSQHKLSKSFRATKSWLSVTGYLLLLNQAYMPCGGSEPSLTLTAGAPSHCVGTHFAVLTIPMQASLEQVDNMGLAAGNSFPVIWRSAWSRNIEQNIDLEAHYRQL